MLCAIALNFYTSAFRFLVTCTNYHPHVFAGTMTFVTSNIYLIGYDQIRLVSVKVMKCLGQFL